MAKKYRVSNIRVFGSTIRDQLSPFIDVDLLIRVKQDCGISLFDLGELQEELEQLIGRPVNLVMDDTLHPIISEQIVEEAQPL